MTLFDGEVVTYRNCTGRLLVTALPGAPVRVTVVPANRPVRPLCSPPKPSRLFSGCCIIPAVLDLRDLVGRRNPGPRCGNPFSSMNEATSSAPSSAFPDGRPVADPNEALFHAALPLSVGDVPNTLKILSSCPRRIEFSASPMPFVS